MLAARALTQDQEKALDDLRQQASEIRRQLLDLERQFEDKYGALASRPATLEEAQKALPEGTALVGWIDTKSEHWACLLRHTGDPAWVRLAGSGKEGAWTKEEEGLPQGLRAELNPETGRGQAGPLAGSLARQRLDPLKGHLAGVRRLIVVNSPGLAGVPVEVLMAARPDPAWDAITVSYAPSASMFAYLAGRPVPRDRPATLLAVADPAYPQPKDDAPAPEPPGAGLAVAGVVPNGNADLNGIREGDVLLSYAGTELKQAGDLKPVASDGGPRKVPVRYWREGITREVEVAAGPLGVDDRPAASVGVRPGPPRVRAGPAWDARRVARPAARHPARGRGGRRALPGRGSHHPPGRPGLRGDRAGPGPLGEAQGLPLPALRHPRRVGPAVRLPDGADPGPRPGRRRRPDGDWRPTGRSPPSRSPAPGSSTPTWWSSRPARAAWACAAGAEGYLGFAQPLFARGARSLVLSQWKVDDDATALLMARFYRNLLGKREGLKAPMPKAEALAEAKRWLRGAGPAEVGAALAALPRGEVVRREAVKAASSAHPYEDPTYWAGFVLVGAPD